MTVAILATAFYGPAAAIAALYFLFKEVAPALAALVRRRIRSRGYSGRIIERAADPQRFDALVRRRLIVGGSGFAFCIVSGAVLIMRNIQLDRWMP